MQGTRGRKRERVLMVCVAVIPTFPIVLEYHSHVEKTYLRTEPQVPTTLTKPSTHKPSAIHMLEQGSGNHSNKIKK